MNLFLRKNYCKNRQITLYLSIAVILFTSPAIAVHDEILFEREGSWILDEFDLHSRDALKRLGGDSSPFSYRHQLSIARSGEGLEGESPVDYTNVQYLDATYSFAALLHLSPGLELFTGMEIEAEKRETEEVERELHLEALYLLQSIGDGQTTIGVGRQEVEDDRTWIIDTGFDGFSLVWKNDKSAFTGVVGSDDRMIERLFESTEEESESAKHDLLFYSRAYRSFSESTQGSVFVTYLRDADSGYGKTWYGLRSLGDLSDRLYYWAEMAWLAGTEDSKKIRGWGIDTGFYYTMRDSSVEPTFTLSFAAGSGDDGLGTDTRFRQTGLQSNANYGELLNPELSNLQVATTGVGIRPNEMLSIELFVHSYWQINPSTEISVDGVEIVPDGVNHSLGEELDFTFRLGDEENLSASFVYGRFWGSNGVDADFGRFEVLWNF